MLKDTLSLSQPLRGSGYNEYLLGKMQNKQGPQEAINQFEQNMNKNSLMDNVSSFATELRSQNLVRAMATVQNNSFGQNNPSGMKPTLSEQGAKIDENGNIRFQNQQFPVNSQQNTTSQNTIPVKSSAIPTNIINPIPINTTEAKQLPQKKGIAINSMRAMALDSKSINILNRIAQKESNPSQGMLLGSRDRNALRSSNNGIKPTAKDKMIHQIATVSNADYQLGQLSKKYESASMGSISIGYDRTGGTSYGTYQLSSRTGTFKRFVEYLQNKEPQWAKKLSEAGAANTGSRTGAVPSAWQALCKENPQRMQELEHDFIVKSHFEPVLSYVKEKWQDTISPAIKEVLFSTSVQHGVNGAKYIVDQALNSMKQQKLQANTQEQAATELLMENVPHKQNPKTSLTANLAEQKSFIENIYAHRKTKFGSSTTFVQEAVKKRFINEQQDAIRMLS